ncbi:hypothetical protein H8S37_03925 [Mediterraneibacter sp. NSJ-55]|uniref:Uncharacterized protein n=1 Tax=Mediterraneibacter hominis TaxID=2763054 RepID=A0A923RR67_9FIRM|nr:hypothetical protein [Mediterraneibacter hominis]MBC5688082.1 hypothetical protein [Mediterraneibacter hominis]
MIVTSRQMIKELSLIKDDFILAELEGKEYVIDCIGHSLADSDCASHIVLRLRNGGEGYIKR